MVLEKKSNTGTVNIATVICNCKKTDKLTDGQQTRGDQKSSPGPIVQVS